MIRINFTYGVGYGSHDDYIDVEADATEEEIEFAVYEAVAEKLNYAWERAE